MCRDYPRLLLYSANPRFLEGCGYYALDKRAKRLRESLEREGVAPEKIAELESSLHLRE